MSTVPLGAARNPLGDAGPDPSTNHASSRPAYLKRAVLVVDVPGKGPSGPFTTCQLSPPSVVASQKREPAWEVNIRVPRSASTNTHCPGKPGWGRPAAASRRHERPPSVVRHSATGAGVRGSLVGGAPATSHAARPGRRANPVP